MTPDVRTRRGASDAALLAAIYGTRYAGRTPIPLWLALAPVSLLLRALPGDAFLSNAPVDVRNVAAAAVDAATDVKYAGKFSVIENAEIFSHEPHA